MKKLMRKLKKEPAEPQPEQSGVPSSEQKKDNSIVSTVLILIFAPLIAILLITFVFQSFQVDGASMEPILRHNDRLIINKLPRTWAKISGHPYVPERGEIIVFTKHNLDQYESTSGDRRLIKRVVGLPGERVVVRDEKLVVYNEEYPKGFQPDKSFEYGKSLEATPGNIDITVPDNEVFVCGDNRNNSTDSRTFGSIPVSDIIGRVSLRLFPLRDAQKF